MRKEGAGQGGAHGFFGAVKKFASAAAFEFGEATRAWSADHHIDALNEELMFLPEGERRTKLLAERAEARTQLKDLQAAAIARQRGEN
jgi:hypothetical protein